MLHPVLEAAFHAFEAAGVHWCLLRLPANLGSPTGGDVDLLIVSADRESVRQVLESCGFVLLPTRGQSPHTHLLSYHQLTDCWIWLDIVTELSFGPFYALRTEAERGCLARRRREGAADVLAPDDAFWVLLLHCLLDKGTIAPRHRTRLLELVAEARMDG